MGRGGRSRRLARLRGRRRGLPGRGLHAADLRVPAARVQKVLVGALSPKRVLSSALAAHCLELRGTPDAVGGPQSLVMSQYPPSATRPPPAAGARCPP